LRTQIVGQHSLGLHAAAVAAFGIVGGEDAGVAEEMLIDRLELHIRQIGDFSAELEPARQHGLASGADAQRLPRRIFGNVASR
jgi:hypothetical protein